MHSYDSWCDQMFELSLHNFLDSVLFCVFVFGGGGWGMLQ